MRGKPFGTRKDLKGRMDIVIYWRNDVHADPENVFGSIADALFFQDKYLTGSFDFSEEMSESARVEVLVTIFET